MSTHDAQHDGAGEQDASAPSASPLGSDPDSIGRLFAQRERTEADWTALSAALQRFRSDQASAAARKALRKKGDEDV